MSAPSSSKSSALLRIPLISRILYVAMANALGSTSAHPHTEFIAQLPALLLDATQVHNKWSSLQLTKHPLTHLTSECWITYLT